MENVQQVRLTKTLFPSEPRHSKQLFDPTRRQMSQAVENVHRVSSFYHAYIRDAKSKNQPINILPRDATQIFSQMKNHQLYICDAGAIPGSRILAASMLWEQEIPIVPPDKGRGSLYDIESFLEIGTQLSILPGFNLQWIMTAVIILERMVYDPVGVVFAATYGDSAISARNMLKNMHFKEWVDIPPTLNCLRMHHLKADGEENRGIKWFRPTLETVNAAAQLIVDLCDEPLRRRVGTYTGGQDKQDKQDEVHTGVKSEVLSALDVFDLDDIPRNEFFFDPSKITAIEFSFDPQAFQLRRAGAGAGEGAADYSTLIRYARRIASTRPRSLDSLKEAVENETISSSFVDLSAPRLQ